MDYIENIENMDTENTDFAEDTPTELSRAELAEFTRRLSGRNEDGESKVILSYQSYAIEDEEGSVGKETVYTSSKCHVELSLDVNNPQYFVMDIVFRGYDEPELKMLWGRLQKFKRSVATNLEKTWVFYMNLLEKASISKRTDQGDLLFTADIINPLLFYLTRETPDFLCTETRSDEGELYGGNVIRMLIPTEFVTFKIRDDIDTLEMKEEVLRENDARNFTDNPELHSYWEE